MATRRNSLPFITGKNIAIGLTALTTSCQSRQFNEADTLTSCTRRAADRWALTAVSPQGTADGSCIDTATARSARMIPDDQYSHIAGQMRFSRTLQLLGSSPRNAAAVRSTQLHMRLVANIHHRGAFWIAEIPMQNSLIAVDFLQPNDATERTQLVFHFNQTTPVRLRSQINHSGSLEETLALRVAIESVGFTGDHAEQQPTPTNERRVVYTLKSHAREVTNFIRWRLRLSHQLAGTLLLRSLQVAEERGISETNTANRSWYGREIEDIIDSALGFATTTSSQDAIDNQSTRAFLQKRDLLERSKPTEGEL